MGCSSDSKVVEQLVAEGNFWIDQRLGCNELDFEQTDKLFEVFVEGIKEVRVSGIEFLLGRLFDAIGFNKIKDELFRKLVLSRLCYPVSKLKTTEYLRRYEGYETDEDKIYRYLDKLYKKQKRIVQQISHKHTVAVLGGEIKVVFYDVTTVYFEIDREDELRKTGYSKDGKHSCPQIVLGLLVGSGGYPLGYEIFKGNKFEGHTMLPVVNLFRRKHNIKKVVVIADAGLLSAQNIESLGQNKCEYILGAKLKNENAELKKQILGLNLENGQSAVIKKDEYNNIVVSYSDSRAKKDAANRQKGIDRLQKQIKSGKLSKSQINNKGYNKFLKMEGELNVTLDLSKVDEDKKWDGFKGYVTNTTLNKEEVIGQYKELWQIEKAFRTAKSEIKVRPVFHYLPRRIEAHICIAFVAYKIYKELERQLYDKKSGLSPEKAIEIAKTIYSIKAIKPKSKEPFEKMLLLTTEQKKLFKLFQ